MKRIAALFIPAIAAIAASPALGHFVYIVPDSSGQEVQVVFSETPQPDEKVATSKFAGTQVFLIDDAGHETRLKTIESAHSLIAKLPAGENTLVRGVTEYGVANSKHTGNIPVHIQYFSKTLLGDLAQAGQQPASQRAPLEIVPNLKDGKLEFLVVKEGRPVPAADCTVTAPGQDKGERSKTTASGMVPGQFDKPGRYGVWARLVDLSPGEFQGTRFEKTHIYATLVIDLPSASGP